MYSARTCSLLDKSYDHIVSKNKECQSLLHGLPFTTNNAYNIIMDEDSVDWNYDFIWSSKATIKVKIFAWLLFRDRLNTKANLHHKNIADSAACPRCHDPCEDAIHLVCRCSFAEQVWILLGFSPPTDLTAIQDARSPDGSTPMFGLQRPYLFFGRSGTQEMLLSSGTNVTSLESADFCLWIYRFKGIELRDHAR